MSDEMEKEWNEFVNGNRELICGFEDALVMAFNAGWFAGKQEAVRLKSESVELKELREWIEKNKRLREFVLIDDLIEWAEKEAKENE